MQKRASISEQGQPVVATLRSGILMDAAHIMRVIIRVVAISVLGTIRNEFLTLKSVERPRGGVLSTMSHLKMITIS